LTDDLVKRLREEVNDHMFGIIQSPLQLEAADRIEQLEAALRLAAGMVSTTLPFDIDHPEEVLEWIMKESAALGEKKDA